MGCLERLSLLCIRVRIFTSTLHVQRTGSRPVLPSTNAQKANGRYSPHLSLIPHSAYPTARQTSTSPLPNISPTNASKPTPQNSFHFFSLPSARSLGCPGGPCPSHRSRNDFTAHPPFLGIIPLTSIRALLSTPRKRPRPGRENEYSIFTGLDEDEGTSSPLPPAASSVPDA